jgi:hypothetical protein
MRLYICWSANGAVNKPDAIAAWARAHPATAAPP